jgi:guanylate kinase
LSEDEVQTRLKELGEPLLDFDLIRKTLDAWTRPLPSSYPTMPLVLVGPSGVGKGRLVKALLKDYSRYFNKLTTHTTRQPRPDETHNVSYHFVSNDTFHNMVKDNKFVEWAKVHDNFYGTSVEELLLASQREKICILEIDIQGAQSIKTIASKYGLRPKFIFISPPDVEVLKRRLVERGTETTEQIELRLRNAELEIKRAEDSKLFGKVLVNEDFEETSKAFFRLMRDWYPALPSISRLRMLQRRIGHIKTILKKTHEEKNNIENHNNHTNETENHSTIILT